MNANFQVSSERRPLTLALSPQAGRGNRDGAAMFLLPVRTGRRCRQADEGRFAFHVAYTAQMTGNSFERNQ